MKKSGKEIALFSAKLAEEKKGEDILLLNMADISSVTDYFLICSAGNTLLAQAIADNVEEQLSDEGIIPLHKEGYAEGRWILLDYGDCVVHIFLDEERNFYNLEQLWADAPLENYTEAVNAQG